VSYRKMYGAAVGKSQPFYVANSSTGGGLEGLTYETEGLICEYRREGQSTWTPVTLVAGTLGTWSSGGFVADGNLAGAYEFGAPAATLAPGPEWALVRFYGAANMQPVCLFIELDAVNYQSNEQFMTIDISTLSFLAAQLLVRNYLVSTGSTTPATADQWAVAGLHNNSPYYASATTSLFAWSNGSGWTISATVGTDGASYWTTASGATVIGPYTAQGSASGTPSFAAHGNAVLAAYQPEIPFPANFNELTTSAIATAVADAVLAEPSYPLVTDSSGHAFIAGAQEIPTSARGTMTTAGCLNAAMAQAGGAWTWVGTQLTLLNTDGSPFYVFTLNATAPASGAPTSRT
jgi:hypothetical protein